MHRPYSTGMGPPRPRGACALLALLLGLPLAAARAADPAPTDFAGLLAAYPQHREWIERARGMTNVYGGTVTVDGQPRAGVRVTDGVDFAITDAAGRYTLNAKPAAFEPYLPFRTVCVCWPEGTWPAADSPWWRRLADVEHPDRVDFRLTARHAPALPEAVFLGETGDGLAGPACAAIGKEIQGGGEPPAFIVGGGFFAGRAAATLSSENFAGVARAAQSLPAPFFALAGASNVLWETWREPGEGCGAAAFARHLGPLHHSFDVGGIRVIFFQAQNIGRSDTDWLGRDLGSVPKDGVVALIAESFPPQLAPFRRDARIRLIQNGNAVRLPLRGAPPRECVLAHGYRRVRLADGRSLLRCLEASGGDAWAHAATCPLRQDWPTCAPDTSCEVPQQIGGGTAAALPVPVSKIAFRIRLQARPSATVTNWGLRFFDAYERPFEVSLRPAAREAVLLGNAGPSREAAGGDAVELRVVVMPEFAIALLNGREAGVGSLAGVESLEIFAEGGAVELTSFAGWDAYDEGYPDAADRIAIARRMTNTFSGTVRLDGKPCPDIKVTDGVDFVRTGPDGRYTITLARNRFWPYAPSRTLSVSWPAGTWPAADSAPGQASWWVRLLDVKDPRNVDFHLRAREQAAPVCVAFLTDPHDAMRRPHNKIICEEIARARPGSVDFAVLGGDLGYIGMANADAEYPLVQQYVKSFPVPIFPLIGNHDVDYPRFREPHELSGDGAFTQYLGPAHWSFDVGPAHLVSMQYSNVGAEDAAWLDRDLSLVPTNRPVYVFMHAWEPPVWGPIDKHADKIRLIQSGHSHQTLYCTPPGGGVEIWTIMSFYRLIYIDGREFDFVDREIASARGGWDDHWNHRGQGALNNDWWATRPLPRGQKREPVPTLNLENVTLTNGAREAPVLEKCPTFDLRVGVRVPAEGAARAWGLRITGEDGAAHEVSYDEPAKELSLLGRRTFFDRELTPAHYESFPRLAEAREAQQVLELRLLAMPDRVQILANNRLGYFRFVRIGTPKKVELFAREGSATFERYDIWQHDYPEYKPVYVRPQ